MARDDGDDVENALLSAMAAEAQAYITSFSWCPDIRRIDLAFGVGGVVALFLVDFVSAIGGEDDRLWVVVGDIPSAYMVVDEQRPGPALENYCDLMDGWARAVLSGSLAQAEVFPVAAAATRQNAEDLLRRVALLRSDLMPLAGMD